MGLVKMAEDRHQIGGSTGDLPAASVAAHHHQRAAALQRMAVAGPVLRAEKGDGLAHMPTLNP